MIISILSVGCSIITYMMRRRLGNIFKLVIVGSVLLTSMSLIRGIPVALKVKEYRELSSVNVSEIKDDEDKYNEFKDKAKELNAWRASYLGVIDKYPLFAFFKDEIKSFKVIKID